MSWERLLGGSLLLAVLVILLGIVAGVWIRR